MPPTTDYEVLVAPTIEELTTLVKTAIADGWQVSGNIGFAGNQLPYRRNAHFYQAMVKTSAVLSQMNTKLTSIQNSVASIDSKTPTPGD